MSTKSERKRFYNIRKYLFLRHNYQIFNDATLLYCKCILLVYMKWGGVIRFMDRIFEI